MKIGDTWVSKTFLILISLSIIAFAIIFPQVKNIYPVQVINKPIPSLQIGDKKFHLELALTEADREKGLSGRNTLDPNTAMLFVFQNDDFWGIWMKDMNFPIDIIWLDSTYKIIGEEANVSPQTYPTTFKPNLPARYVIEANSGFIDQNDLVFGTRVLVSY